MYNKMTKLILIFVLVFSFPGSAYSKTDTEIETAIENELMNRHPSDTGEFWTGLGPTAPDVIIQKYVKADNSYHKTRLLAGLGFFPENSKAVDFLKEQAESSDDSIVRNTAIRSIAHSQGAGEIDFLSRFLKSEDLQTRLATAKALRSIKDSRAKSVLENFLKSEGNSWIKDQLKNSQPVSPLKPLSIVSSNSDALSPLFNGKWKGYFIIPGPGKVGLKSKQVYIQLTVENGRTIQGQIEWTKKTTKESISFSKLEGQANKLKGVIQYALNNKMQKLDFEFELFDKGDTSLIKGDLKPVNGGLIAQKED
jgi:hypothetical protein